MQHVSSSTWRLACCLLRRSSGLLLKRAPRAGGSQPHFVHQVVRSLACVWELPGPKAPSSHRARSAARSVSRTLAGDSNPEGGKGDLASFLFPNGEGDPDQEMAEPSPRYSILDKGVRVEPVSFGTPQEVEDRRVRQAVAKRATAAENVPDKLEQSDTNSPKTLSCLLYTSPSPRD